MPPDAWRHPAIGCLDTREQAAGRESMKTIGLLGGMSWDSSLEYYRLINERVRELLGALHCASSIMLSLDFTTVEEMQNNGRWSEAARLLIDASERLVEAGADLLVVCSNTMHMVADELEEALPIPLLHIADPTATDLKAAGHQHVGLLGTRHTMEESFYKDRLRDRHGLDVLIPEPADREIVDSVIYEELVRGVTCVESRGRCLEVVERLGSRGAEAVILGCTELGLLLTQEDTDVPIFDTTRSHARAAADLAVSAQSS